MTTPQPLISAIVAVYNGEAFIGEALHSILDQHYAPLEIVVVDDGSTDASALIVQTIARATTTPIRYAYQPNQGHPAALNHALRLAQGEVLAFLDADDVWMPNRLPAQLARLAIRPDAEGKAQIVLGRMEYFSDGATISPGQLEQANARPYHYNLSASLISRLAFATVGGFDETLAASHDWDWFVRAKEANIPTAIENGITVKRRVHTGNMTRQQAKMAHYAITMVKYALDRRRVKDRAVPAANITA
jgi:glycosyltransferase involved in cell wall biosynthesis